MDHPILQDVLDLIVQKRILKPDPSRDSVINFELPEELEKKLNLTIDADPISDEERKAVMERTIHYSLYHGTDIYGLAGSWLSDALNTNNHTFEVAPVFVVIERFLIRYLLQSRLGWTDGDGIFAPGGSISNMYGMVLARYRKFPEIKTSGYYGMKPLVVFTSDESHYSIKKGANWLGLGIDNVITIPTDDKGAMIPTDLENAILDSIRNDKTPFFVNATSGTTVMGGFDDLQALASICQKYDLWLHVDACWGGSAFFSNSHRHLMNGCELADSVAWNPHKMMGSPLQSSLFFVRHPRILHECNSASAQYLFQQDKFYDVNYDTGDKSIQCGRKVDGFKVWFMLKTRGERYFETLIDSAFEHGRYFAELIERQSPNFRLLNPGFQGTNILFVCIPPCLLGLAETNEWNDKLSRVPPMVKETMTKRGSLMIGYQPLPHKNIKNCFRMVVHCNPRPTKDDMNFVLHEIRQCCESITF